MSGLGAEVQFTVLVSTGAGVEFRSPRRFMPERCQEAVGKGKREIVGKTLIPLRQVYISLFSFYF